jgi:hypothetical protein
VEQLGLKDDKAIGTPGLSGDDEEVKLDNKIYRNTHTINLQDVLDTAIDDDSLGASEPAATTGSTEATAVTSHAFANFKEVVQAEAERAGAEGDTPEAEDKPQTPKPDEWRPGMALSSVPDADMGIQEAPWLELAGDGAEESQFQHDVVSRIIRIPVKVIRSVEGGKCLKTFKNFAGGFLSVQLELIPHFKLRSDGLKALKLQQRLNASPLQR